MLREGSKVCSWSTIMNELLESSDLGYALYQMEFLPMLQNIGIRSSTFTFQLRKTIRDEVRWGMSVAFRQS